MIDDDYIKKEKERREQRLKENFLKAKSFFDNKIKVHLIKTDREWFNGLIVEFTTDFFIINDLKKGDRLVFFVELWDIEEMVEDDK